MTRSGYAAGHRLWGVCAVVLAVLPAAEVYSQGLKPTPLDGAWKLVERKIGGSDDYQKPPDSMEMIKYVTGGRYVYTVVGNGRVLSAAGGKYKVDNDKYTESVEYIHGDGQAPLVGKSFDFTWKLDGDTWTHKGVVTINNREFNIDERWERCK